MSTATLSRSDVIRLRERRRPRAARPWSPIQPRGCGLWDETLAKAKELATPDGHLNLRELARALKISERGIRARRSTIVRHWGASVWPWVSPVGRLSKPRPVYREPLTSDPPPEGWEEVKAAVRVEGLKERADDDKAPLQIDDRCDGPGFVYKPPLADLPPVVRQHALAEMFPGPKEQEVLTGYALQLKVAEYISEWKAGRTAAVEDAEDEED